ncbi:MAG: ParA family protein [Coriobacteriia bacterium]|nr:ParA family protein [Coriobacteriia bacterium]
MLTNGNKAANGVVGAPWLTIITGHYGVGKTNLSLNIARDLRLVTPRVTLVDLDVVNPYFRSTDNRGFLDTHGIQVLGPVYGASNLDTPSLSPGIDHAILDAGPGHAVIIDVGGDADGARALGRYAPKIALRPHRLIHVVNLRRPETASVEDNLQVLRDIETTAGLKVTGIIGNTHLKELSTAVDIVAAVRPTCAVAKAAGIPLTSIAVPRALANEVEAALAGDAGLCGIGVYRIDIIVGTPWELE